MFSVYYKLAYVSCCLIMPATLAMTLGTLTKEAGIIFSSPLFSEIKNAILSSADFH